VTAEERASIKLKIKASIEAVEENISSLEFSIGQLPNPDDLERHARIDMMNYKRNCEAQIRAAIKKKKELDVAQKRVDSDDYGICIECDKPIEVQKLLLIPETFYCVQCHKL